MRELWNRFRYVCSRLRFYTVNIIVALLFLACIWLCIDYIVRNCKEESPVEVFEAFFVLLSLVLCFAINVAMIKNHIREDLANYKRSKLHLANSANSGNPEQISEKKKNTKQ